MEGIIGYNIGLELVNCYNKAFDKHEVDLHQVINKIKDNNIQLKIMNDVMNKLSHAKPEKKADFSQDEEAKKFLYIIHNRNGSILGEELFSNLPAINPTLNEIIDEMRKEGIKEDDINLPSILERVNINGIQFNPISSEEDIDTVIQGLDAEIKMINADQNELMLHFSSKVEDRSSLTENARQVLKEYGEGVSSIIRKTGRGG